MHWIQAKTLERFVVVQHIETLVATVQYFETVGMFGILICAAHVENDLFPIPVCPPVQICMISARALFSVLSRSQLFLLLL